MRGRSRVALTWAGKDDRPPAASAALVEEPSRAHGEPGDPPNMLVHGDNLLALRALRETHAGAVKCVYIDPPYNTNHAVSDHYEDGVEHAAWLSHMRDRIEVLRELLAPDGAMFVHLDDNELDYLKVLMDEVFGRAQFVGRITIDARSPSAFSTVNPGVFKASEYLLWYARDRSRFVENDVRVPRPWDAAYNQWLVNPEADCSAWRFTTVREAFSVASGTGRRPDAKALEAFVVANAARVFRLAAISDTGAGRLTLETKARSVAEPDTVFRVDRGPHAEPQFVVRGQQMVFYDRNVRVIDGERSPSRLLTNIWTDIAWEGIAAEGGVTFKRGKKPEKLLKRCLDLCTRPGDLVLDAFAGSGTTAAVAHKMRRRWVTVESGEHAVTLCVPRLAAVVDGRDKTGVTKAVGWQGGGGFRFYRVG